MLTSSSPRLRPHSAPLGCLVGLLLSAIAPWPSVAAEIPTLEPAAIPIPVEPAPAPAPSRSSIPAPLPESLRTILTEGLEQLLRGEPAAISPAMATQIAEALATQVEQAAQTEGAPVGLSRLAETLRILMTADSETVEQEAVTAIKDAIISILDTIP